MTQLMSPFNPMQFDPSQSSGSFPIGKHVVVIESSEIKATSKNDGGYLQLNLKSQEGNSGPYRLNLYNNSAQAVEIANRQLSAICHVLQTFQLGANGTDISVLYNKPFVIEVVPQKNDPQYTEIKRVYDINGNEPGKAGQGAAPQAPVAPAAPPMAPPPEAPAAPSAPAWGAPPAQAPAPQQQAPQGWGAPPVQQPSAPAPQQGAAPPWGQPR